MSNGKTNFPKKGDNKEINLNNSNWKLFDPELSLSIKEQYPKIWSKAGGPTAEHQFSKLFSIWQRGGKPANKIEEDAIRKREIWASQHSRDFKLRGIIAQIKWLVIGNRGEKHMKDILNKEIQKQKDKINNMGINMKTLGEFELSDKDASLMDELSGILKFLDGNISKFLDLVLKFDMDSGKRMIIKSLPDKLKCLDIDGAKPIEIEKNFSIPYLLYRTSEIIDTISPKIKEFGQDFIDISEDIKKVREVVDSILDIDIAKQTEVQTLIFSKEKFKRKSDAIRWAEDHNFKTSKVDETGNSFRLRQKDPSEFQSGSFRTIELTSGVKAVIGRPKKTNEKNIIEDRNNENSLNVEKNDENDLTFHEVKILCKSSSNNDNEQRTALGVVLEPETIDLQDDIYNAEEIEKTAWNWMVKFQNTGIMHKEINNKDILLLESYIAPVDFQIEDQEVKKGTWLMKVMFIDDNLWTKVRSGEFTGFSVGGSAIKRPETIVV